MVVALTTAEALPLTHTLDPVDQPELIAQMQECSAGAVAMYPLGGRTSLGYGLPARQSGVGMSLGRLDRIVDYPARDLTVTVEAGVTMARLMETLAAENQELPMDVPASDRATIGGVIATNWNGPRRYGWGSVRDQVIGISAVDGRGAAFKGGGRVVKNVAGYDFCKLLTGSYGTLGIISQVTLKLRPRSERRVWMATALGDLAHAEELLGRLVHSDAIPCAVELVGGPAWHADSNLQDLLGGPDRWGILVGLEGTAVEVAWMVDQLALEWRQAGAARCEVLSESSGQEVARQLVDFSAVGDSPLVLKASVVPSGVAAFVRAAREVDPESSILSHAGNGIVFVRMSRFPAGGLSRSLLATLQPAAAVAHGKVVILSNPSGTEATRQSWWGGIDAPWEVMHAVKRQFDPRNLLNPGRFVFP